MTTCTDVKLETINANDMQINYKDDSIDLSNKSAVLWNVAFQEGKRICYRIHIGIQNSRLELTRSRIYPSAYQSIHSRIQTNIRTYTHTYICTQIHVYIHTIKSTNI